MDMRFLYRNTMMNRSHEWRFEVKIAERVENPQRTAGFFLAGYLIYGI
jgi:hypothetical protein